MRLCRYDRQPVHNTHSCPAPTGRELSLRLKVVLHGSTLKPGRQAGARQNHHCETQTKRQDLTCNSSWAEARQRFEGQGRLGTDLTKIRPLLLTAAFGQLGKTYACKR